MLGHSDPFAIIVMVLWSIEEGISDNVVVKTIKSLQNLFSFEKMTLYMASCWVKKGPMQINTCRSISLKFSFSSEPQPTWFL